MFKKHKLILTSFLLSQTLSLIFLAFLVLAPRPVLAENIQMTFQVPISEDTKQIDIGPDSIGKYIKALYNYLIGSVGIIATVVLMYGGVLWITAMGNPGQITEAKAWITAAMTGMVIALSSYVILYWVNPDLLAFKPIAPTMITANNLICCSTSTGQVSTISSNTGGNTTYSCPSSPTDITPCTDNKTCKSQSTNSTITYSCASDQIGCCRYKDYLCKNNIQESDCNKNTENNFLGGYCVLGDPKNCTTINGVCCSIQ